MLDLSEAVAQGCDGQERRGAVLKPCWALPQPAIAWSSDEQAQTGHLTYDDGDPVWNMSTSHFMQAILESCLHDSQIRAWIPACTSLETDCVQQIEGWDRLLGCTKHTCIQQQGPEAVSLASGLATCETWTLMTVTSCTCL